MKKIVLGMLAGALALGSTQGFAADALTLQLKWVTQAQFAGYYVAKDKGFYTDEGIDITIKPGGPDVAPEQVIAGGGADVIVDWMGGALAAREQGVPLVNIAQPFKKSGLLMICPKDGPIKTEADFPGHTLGVWFYGNEYPFFAWMNKLGVSTAEGDAKGVKVLKQNFDVSALVDKQADCISVMTYNELGQAIDAGFTLDKLTVFNYTELGNDLLEDGLYTTQAELDAAGGVDKLTRFVRASQKGWDYAIAHPDEAAQIVIDNDESGAQTLAHQQYMMTEVGKLIDTKDFSLSIPAYDRTEKALLDQKIIKAKPEGAYITAITDALK
ncbi:ABC transporter substrate-binding protein [Devosia sp.]|uniref:ABC transporter substrate-binding protein n=1 Tax=Devosia sp. TaxID=1871048 RepID=UPI003266E64E